MSTKSKKNLFRFIAEDLSMLLLLILNLTFIIFDWLFQSELFRSLVFSVSAGFHDFYAAHIHPDFVFYDLIFVSIFLAEFFLRWVRAAIRNEYDKWYFYPFIHWYDLIGCIPIGAFRFLRLLRLISIGIRLHKMGWIDLTNMPLFSFFIHYFNLFVQEVTDRVTLKILSNVQQELEDGTPVIDRIIEDVIIPRRNVLVGWISERLRLAASRGIELHESEIKDYVQVKINLAVEKNKELRNLENVPILGNYIVGQIEAAISDIVFSVVNGLIADLGSDKSRFFVEDISELLLTEDEEGDSNQIEYLNMQLATVISESLSIIMARIEKKDLNALNQTSGEERIRERIRTELSSES